MSSLSEADYTSGKCFQATATAGGGEAPAVRKATGVRACVCVRGVYVRGVCVCAPLVCACA